MIREVMMCYDLLSEWWPFYGQHNCNYNNVLYLEIHKSIFKSKLGGLKLILFHSELWTQYMEQAYLAKFYS